MKSLKKGKPRVPGSGSERWPPKVLPAEEALDCAAKQEIRLSYYFEGCKNPYPCPGSRMRPYSRVLE